METILCQRINEIELVNASARGSSAHGKHSPILIFMPHSCLETIN